MNFPFIRPSRDFKFTSAGEAFEKAVDRARFSWSDMLNVLGVFASFYLALCFYSWAAR